MQYWVYVWIVGRGLSHELDTWIGFILGVIAGGIATILMFGTGVLRYD